MTSSLWMNRGSLVAENAVNDRGFRLGWRVMTTMLAVDRQIIDFDWHMERLEAHAESLGLSEGLRTDVIRFELESLLESISSPNKKTNAACRVYLTAGDGGMHAPIKSVQRWTQVEAYTHTSAVKDGVKLQTIVDPSWSRGERIKTGLYPYALPAVPRAKAHGFDDVLWCNSDHEIAEATTANIFLIGRDGDLVEIATPPPSSGILSGVTRRRVIELLTSANIRVTERVIYKDELPRFDEAFVTSSLSGLIPVTTIGNHRLQTLRSTAVYSHLQRLWTTWLSTQLPSSL